MNSSKIALSLVLIVLPHVAHCFRISPDGSPDHATRIREEEVKPPLVPPIHNRILGTSEECSLDYWSRPDIHTLGNVGFGGAVHAALAPLATKLIDEKAYGGVDVRAVISHELRGKVNKTRARVMDLCSGVGISTRALGKAFHDADCIVGVDTSHEMIKMAEAITKHQEEVRKAFSRHAQGLAMFLTDGFKGLQNTLSDDSKNGYIGKNQVSYTVTNAENTGYPSSMFDLVTIMYGFHEVPMEGRSRIVNEAKRLLRVGGLLAILDICPTYQPSEHMLAGEPFVLEYKRNIDCQVFNSPGFLAKKRVVVAGHVNLWLLTKKDSLFDPES